MAAGRRNEEARLPLDAKETTMSAAKPINLALQGGGAQPSMMKQKWQPVLRLIMRRKQP
jgi:hypothetical protein